MSGPRLSLALALALMATPVLADQAQPRGGGGSSGGSSVGAQHHSGSGTAVPRNDGSSGSSASHTDAQQRHPRAVTGSHYHSHYYPYYPYYYPYWGPYSWGYGYDPYYSGFYFGAGYSPYYGGAYYYDDDHEPYASGAVRLLVDPDKARVLVNGYYAGIVDDFDGIFQHLDLPAGSHEIKLQLEGYQTQRFRVYVAPEQTVKIHFDMVKGSGENPSELTVGDKQGAEAYMREASREARDRYEASRRAMERGTGRGVTSPSEVERGDQPPRAPAATLHLTVEPDDASVYVDGTFRGTARQSRSLDVPPGRHRIEVVRPGYRTVERDVEIEAGKPTDLDVTLEK
jgi:PEGA domain-containing protein